MYQHCLNQKEHRDQMQKQTNRSVHSHSAIQSEGNSKMMPHRELSKNEDKYCRDVEKTSFLSDDSFRLMLQLEDERDAPPPKKARTDSDVSRSVRRRGAQIDSNLLMNAKAAAVDAMKGIQDAAETFAAASSGAKRRRGSDRPWYGCR